MAVLNTVQTRFPPEPNGYLHLGHAKAICLHFGLAQKYGWVCNLRFDDTNPEKEDSESVESIKEDIRWLDLIGSICVSFQIIFRSSMPWRKNRSRRGWPMSVISMPREIRGLSEALNGTAAKREPSYR